MARRPISGNSLRSASIPRAIARSRSSRCTTSAQPSSRLHARWCSSTPARSARRSTRPSSSPRCAAPSIHSIRSGEGRTMRARIRDTEIYFDIEGMGLVPDGRAMREKPVAFIIHGGPGGDHSSFKPVTSPLAERMQLVYFDHRGQGRSAHGDPAKYTLDENVEDMEALRRHLGLGAIVSIGTSYGGMVALAHAARYPTAVSHLIAVVSAAHGGFIKRAQEILEERGTPEQREVAAPVWQGAMMDRAQMQRFYAVMGPLYSRRHDPAAAALGHERTLHEPEPLNPAFGGFPRAFDLKAELC